MAIQGNEEECVFFNKGLEIWETERAKWLDKKLSSGICTSSATNARVIVSCKAIEIDVDEIIDHILTNRWRTPVIKIGGEESIGDTFPCAVPLTQLVDILVDLWEAEGLDC
eukprot:CAMPEP_0197840998 /NCGR_PEP_ID=MMETSP1437-20131217/45925_1 /TAXON_ID=49252 ORGANISM="Eucampia antarctica, Strain CCMP1452" /NCGR_SAMPLE_ID=MMETSP1437 /ASSEMBLY_ACC=CAM_ASM_001096 /LENGTH=110 /DNA_ID=CAMNT_0043450687 /DNA_START=115 /DNA_END=447 /DNA_ORIENTATION=-